MPTEPAAPVVELPRVDAAQFQFYDHTVGAYLVTADAALARWIDTLCSTPPGAVAADIETRGLDADKFAITCVTVAFYLGSDTVVLLLDPLRRDEHRGMLARVLDHAQTIVFHGASFDIAPLYAHRLMTREHIRKIGDTLVVARMVNTYAKAGRSLEDLSTAYAVMGDDRTTMKEVFAARGLRKDDGWWYTDIDTPTYVVGAMSDTVATLRLWGTPGVAGSGITAAAARYLTTAQMGLGGCGVLNPADAQQLVADVQQVNRIVLERTARGYAVDPQFCDRFVEHNEQDWVAAAEILAAAGIRRGNGKDLVTVLHARGELPQPWPTTPTGQLKADKKALEVFDSMDASRSELVAAHQLVATSEKVYRYLNKVVENSRPTGRLHPEIKILGASATGRMCLPEDQRLLTRRGVVCVDDIRVGDRTLGADGKWTTVRAIHRFSDAALMTTRLRSGTVLVATPEHRWVTFHLLTGRETVQTLPEALAATDDGVVTTGLRMTCPAPQRICRTPGHGAARRAGHVSGKLAQWESCRRASALAAGGAMWTDAPSAQLMMVDRMMSTRVGTFRLMQQVLESGLSDVSAFLAGLSETSGTDLGGVLEVACGGSTVRDAAALAAYRLGVRTEFVETQQGPALRLRYDGQDLIGAQVDIDESGADVWCVTTDSGTFTAWGANGPYLTGNSASNPEIQQFPKQARGIIVADPGTEWISADWKSIEPVVLATASGDGQFLADMRAGQDPYEPVGQMAGIDRKLAKRKMLADMYGQGHAAAALQYGWSLERAKEVAWAIRDGLPILYSLIDELKAQSRRAGCVTTLSGRVVDQRFSFIENGQLIHEVAARIAANHFCQGSALDIMHHSILELDRRGLSDHVHLWMHDEIVADKDIQVELSEVMATPPPFLAAAAAQRGVEAFLAVDVNPMGPRWDYV